ncbi:MAG: tRNA adenosine(34) deaminase TadA [Bdellovibrionaceae bacterium]|nr:tRNA adenosine(34) deaminase TadA [Pseudobdellovibrionaceae bacterium]
MHKFSAQDTEYMRRALSLAESAAKRGEVPVGALLVSPEGTCFEGYNLRESLKSSLAHAEIIALQRAHQSLGRWRLTDCTLYVTLEPCIMCAGAIVQARIHRLVFAAPDPKAGAVKSLYQICTDSRLNHRVKVEGSLLAEESSKLLIDFFRHRRNQNRLKKQSLSGNPGWEPQ